MLLSKMGLDWQSMREGFQAIVSRWGNLPQRGPDNLVFADLAHLVAFTAGWGVFR
jgi:hypothetical protein